MNLPFINSQLHFKTYLCPYFFLINFPYILRIMSKEYVNRHVENKQKPSSTHTRLSKHLKNVYPFELKKTSSLLSLSSLSLTLSRNSSGSFTDSSSTVDQAISSVLDLIPTANTSVPILVAAPDHVPQPSLVTDTCDESLKRCNWITKTSGKQGRSFNTEGRGLGLLIFFFIKLKYQC